jgi:Concanavalin A-like lectin/glucanases superfamily
MGLVGLWHLDESSGVVVADSSGEVPPNNGTLQGLDSTAWVPGHIGGGALEINAKGYVLVPPTPSIDSISFQVSAAAWIYLDAGGKVMDYATAISRETGTTLDQRYHLSLNSQEQPATWIGNVVIHADKAITPMTWTHLAVTYDGAQAILYVDGQPAKSQAVTGLIPADTTPIILGGNGNGLKADGSAKISELFPGVVDEIALYNRALTASEVGQLAAGVQF